jgi:hypothetical protein
VSEPRWNYIALAEYNDAVEEVTNPPVWRRSIVNLVTDDWLRRVTEYKGEGYGNILDVMPHGTWVNSLKKGNLSNRRSMFLRNPVTLLNTCGTCGKTSTPRKISRRSGIAIWYTQGGNNGRSISYAEYDPVLETLCMGCWNKVRAIVKKEYEAYEIKRLSNKLYREVRQWQKSQHQVN